MAGRAGAILLALLLQYGKAPTPVLGAGESARILVPSLTLPENEFISLTQEGKPASVWGELLFPSDRSLPFPSVVLAHGCGGAGPSMRGWAQELGKLGVASFILDSFSGRGIQATCTGENRINRASRVIDVYRALQLLSTHPRIDPYRIALMGFSQGGGVALLARQVRFHALWMSGDRTFAAYLAFYPANCNRTLLRETKVIDRPLRIFHGTADDWTPIESCREYARRMRAADHDVNLVEYPEAQHAFDNPNLPPTRFRNRALNAANCLYIEREPGRFRAIHRTTGERSTPANPCMRRGATVGHHPAAYKQALEDVRSFLRRVFELSPVQ